MDTHFKCANWRPPIESVEPTTSRRRSSNSSSSRRRGDSKFRRRKRRERLCAIRFKDKSVDQIVILCSFLALIVCCVHCERANYLQASGLIDVTSTSGITEEKMASEDKAEVAIEPIELNQSLEGRQIMKNIGHNQRQRGSLLIPSAQHQHDYEMLNISAEPFLVRHRRHLEPTMEQKQQQQQQQQQQLMKQAPGRNKRRQVIHAMLRGQVFLPCNLEPNEPDDSVSLVLWYKDKSMVPIYSLDARSSSVQEARQKPGPWLEGRSQLKFVMHNNNNDLDHHDSSGHHSPSSNFDVELNNNNDELGAEQMNKAHQWRHTPLSTAPTTSERRRKRHNEPYPKTYTGGSFSSMTGPIHGQPEGENDGNLGAGMGLLEPEMAQPLTRQQQQRRQQLWAHLQIGSLSSEDNGVYVCRVDFRRARSRTHELALKIIVPADTPTIRDLSPRAGGYSAGNSETMASERAGRVIGPHDEGSRVVLECETQGGYPEPSLSWWRDGRLIDDTYEVVTGSSTGASTVGSANEAGGSRSSELPVLAVDEDSMGLQETADPASIGNGADGTSGGDGQTANASGPVGSKSQVARLIRNRLELAPLTRNDLLANYSCQASNSKLSEPPTSFVMIDMNLRPVKVQIENDRLPVLADRPLEILCRAHESRPAALISWYRGSSGSGNEKLAPRPAGESPPAQQMNSSNLSLAASFVDGQIKIEESFGSDSVNVTSSTLTIWPRIADSGQIVTCRAENPYMSEGHLHNESPSGGGGGPHRQSSRLSSGSSSSLSWIEDSWKLEVHHLPRVKLQLGDKLQGQSIREGNDVYFECSVLAQPYAHEIRWWLNGKELESNLSSGIIVSNQSLVLQRVSKSQRGHYTCSAINSVGESHSNSLYLRVQFAPRCRDESSSASSSSNGSLNLEAGSDLFRTNSQHKFKSHYGAARMESVRVYCHVDADPAESLVYKWAFLPTSGQQPSPPNQNRGQQQQPPLVYLEPSSFGSEAGLGPLVSVATYTPRSELDYGTLLCWAQNSLGQQADPCSYQLVAAERPDPVRNCRLVNASDTQLTVACEPGYHGGVEQSFQMEVYEGRKHGLVANVTSNGSIQLDRKDARALNNSIKSGAEADMKELEDNRMDGGDEDDDDDNISPASAALSLTSSSISASSARQQKQRHSLHHHQQPKAGSNQPEALFITEPNLRPATNYFLSIYSTNSKGSSKPVAFSASTANYSGSPEASSSSRASGFGHSDNLLGDVLSLSWSPFLLVCSISVLMFVLFASITFAIMKYVDFSQSFAISRTATTSGQNQQRSNGADSAAGLKSSLAAAATAASDNLVCLSKSDVEQQSSCSNSSSASDRSCPNNNNRRVNCRSAAISLTANNSGSRTLADKDIPLNGILSDRKDKVSLLNGSYLKMKFQQITQSPTKLKQSNSDNFLDQLTNADASSSAHRHLSTDLGTLPKNKPVGFVSASNFRFQPASTGTGSVASGCSTLNSQQKNANSRTGNYGSREHLPRVEQLLISGKQYFHQTAPKQQQQQRHLQMTSCASAFVQQPSSSLYPATASSTLMKHDYHHQPPLCMHQQLIEGCQLTKGENYCHAQPDLCGIVGLDGSSNNGKLIDQMLMMNEPHHLAHLRLVDSGLAAIDSDCSNSNQSNTQPSVFSTMTNGSPSSGIAMVTPTPSVTTSVAQVPSSGDEQQQHQVYLTGGLLDCCGAQQQLTASSGVNLASGSSADSTLTSSIADQAAAAAVEMLSGCSSGGNVISVSEAYPSRVPIMSEAKISQNDAHYLSPTERQHLDKQYSLYVDGHLNNNDNLEYSIENPADQRVYLFDTNQNKVVVDQKASDEQHNQMSYPTKARVRLVSRSSRMDNDTHHHQHHNQQQCNYLTLVGHPSGGQLPQQQQQLNNKNSDELHTDV